MSTVHWWCTIVDTSPVCCECTSKCLVVVSTSIAPVYQHFLVLLASTFSTTLLVSTYLLLSIHFSSIIFLAFLVVLLEYLVSLVRLEGHVVVVRSYQLVLLVPFPIICFILLNISILITFLSFSHLITFCLLLFFPIDIYILLFSFSTVLITITIICSTLLVSMPVICCPRIRHPVIL